MMELSFVVCDTCGGMFADGVFYGPKGATAQEAAAQSGLVPSYYTAEQYALLADLRHCPICKVIRKFEGGSVVGEMGKE